MGFRLDSSTVSRSKAAGNFGAGFVLSSGASLLDSVSGTNAAEGVRVDGARCRLEGNHVHSNVLGIGVTSAGNLIARNVLQQNISAYSIVNGNSYGPFLTIGGGAMGSTNSWANWQY